MKNYNNFHCFDVKYLGATNTKGSRVKITSRRQRRAVTISFMHELNSIEDMAATYLEGQGFNIVGVDNNLVISDTFEPLKKNA